LLELLLKRIDTRSALISISACACGVLLGACGPADTVPNVPSRTVPYPLQRSTADVSNDSIVIVQWTTRAEIPDPLADQDGGPKIRLEATLYGEDVIAATVAAACRSDSADGENCRRRERAQRAQYDAENLPDSLLRIRLNLQSTFSVNSLDRKFWDIYVKDERDIAHEPLRVEMHEPVIVREDTLPEPGRATLRGGLYRRVIDLYFPLRTPFGVRTVSPEASEVRLIISRERKELANLVWQIQRQGRTTSAPRPRGRGGPPDF